ncbi:bifunctional diguanylate cyclase/phosphodiesterase [Novosphingobium sp. KCTC 2891]|uniref:putative bifunctional diguanylate cyclase/phosphodiesterase n=1 Tax=Novosphingobium sp. KCTC 2891 TaxID=2989730 RepID=UPI0022236E3C|nr:bifunctional diguanylate cyclase/phosphodiesterase [Novosphingobium sp. KCTC 2891]MCW1381249.1 bifunctional diguanylate cyclase/phosphodiesterase [Novosphingobium sp. KCTC 2891]
MADGLRTGWVALGTFLALVALSGALVAAFNHSTRVADDLAREDERVLARRYVDRAMRAFVATQKVQLTWDDAMNGAVLRDDVAWSNYYLGQFFWNNFGTDELFLVRPDGSMVHGWREGRTADAAAFAQVRRDVGALLAAAQKDGATFGQPAAMRSLADTVWPVDAHGRPLTRWAARPVLHNGRPAFLAVASIVPDRDYALLRAQPNYVASLRYIDTGTLIQMRQDLLLPQLHFGTERPAVHFNVISLSGIGGGKIGWLGWVAKTPGPKIVRRTAPLLATYILFFLGVMVGGAIIVRRMRRTAQELSASEAQAQHNALHDAMSGLPNRVHYMQKLRSELADCITGRAKGDVFVAYIDIDSFKVVNDTLGHHVGDELVRQVALRLRRMLPTGDFLSRFGGDEFVLMRRAEGGGAAADTFGRQLMQVMREPFVISGNSLEVTCSCGISWGPEQSEDPGELLRRADIALYRAKQRGRSRYRRFTRDMDASVKLRREMEMELRRAITRDELSVAFQPIVGIDSAEIDGFEALLRWNHPERGEIRPGLFVPIAEQAGLMIPLGNWMLRHVFAECRDWPACDVSVNLSPLQIMAGDFLKTIAGIVTETGVDPRRIVLEVTEGIMLDRSDHVVTVLRELNRMGFRIALDDFGIGYSSLSYLRSFQFDRIKIDRSFVQNIEGDMDAHSILCAIVSLGHTLRMKVVAEGVETDVQRRLVQAAGCELVQGHLFWQALPVADARALLYRRTPSEALRMVG